MIKQLISVWESSVRASHSFLSEKEIENIKSFVPQALKTVDILILAENDENIPVAFMGIEDNKLEMLFVSAMSEDKGLARNYFKMG